jgi:hypothetical protein
MPGGRPKLTDEEKARRAAEKAAKPKGKPGRPKKEKAPPKAVGRPVKTLREVREELRTGATTGYQVRQNTPALFKMLDLVHDVTHALPKHIAAFTMRSEEDAMARADASPAALADLKARRMLPSYGQSTWLEAWLQAHPEADTSLVTALRRRVEQTRKDTAEEQAAYRRRQELLAPLLAPLLARREVLLPEALRLRRKGIREDERGRTAREFQLAEVETELRALRNEMETLRGLSEKEILKRHNAED